VRAELQELHARHSVEQQKLAQMHREEVKEMKATVAALRYGNARGCLFPFYEGLF
jgi:hypothetical protein